MVSYEVFMGLSVLGVVLLSGNQDGGGQYEDRLASLPLVELPRWASIVPGGRSAAQP